MLGRCLTPWQWFPVPQLIAHAAALWISAAVYTAAVTADVVLVSSRTPSSAITGIFLLITFVGGGLQALFTLWVAATGETGPVRLAIKRRRAARARRCSRRRGTAHPGRVRSAVAILATASLAGGVLCLRYANNFAAHHRTTTGTVTAVQEYQSYCGEDCGSVANYRITVRYRPAGSKPVTFVSNGFDHPMAIGTRLPVYYVSAPGNGYASLDPPSDKQGDGIFWIVVGSLLFLLLSLEVIIALATGGTAVAPMPQMVRPASASRRFLPPAQLPPDPAAGR